MASSGVSQIYGRCFLIFMASIILIEGVIYLGLAIWGLTQENCGNLVYTTNEPFHFATDFLYFIKEECEENFEISYDNQVSTVTMNWQDSEEITNRMYIFLITYASISGIWILFSVFTIFALCGTITSTTVAIFFWPWFASVIAGSILDLVAAGYFISDITHTTTVPNAFTYVGADIDDLNGFDYSKWNSFFLTPPIVMTCISLRLIIIWLLNVFGASFCISLVRAMIKPKAEVKVTAAPVAGVTTQATVVAATAPPHPYPQQQQQQTPQALQAPPEYPQQIAPKPLPVQTPTQVVAATAYVYQQPEQRTSYPPQRPQSPQTPFAPYPATAAVVQQQQQQQQQQQLQRQPSTPTSPQVAAVIGVERALVHTPAPESTTYRNTESHPDRLNYPSAGNTSLSGVSTSTATAAQLSNESALNSRYSMDPVATQAQQARVSDELRSQLPWSYTSMLTKPPPPPRKPQVQIYPDIPEPDYTKEQPKPQTPQDAAAYSRW